MWRSKVNDVGLDNNTRHNQITVTSKNYEDPTILEPLETLHNIHRYVYINFNTFDVIRYTKPTD